MVNFFVVMTDSQSRRWERIRARGESKYVLKKTLLYGALIPSILIWGLFRWTTFPSLLMWLLIFSVPVDYALARLSWHYQEYRYNNRRQALKAGTL